MSRITTHAWRIAFVASGVALVAGGSRHPDADSDLPARQELASMTAHEDWWLSHSFIVVSASLLALGLWLAHRHRSWPARLHRALAVTAVIMSAYVVETVFHLASAVDTDELRNGDFAPVAFSHMALAFVLYPISGFAIAFLSAKIFATAQLWGKPFAAVGMVAGTLHALSVPLTFVFPDAELSPVFAGASVLLAVWALGTGLTGLGSPARARSRAAVPVGSSVGAST